MANRPTPLNLILTKVAIIRDNIDDYDFYNIHELEELNLSTDDYHKCRFFNVDGIITFENKKYKIIKVSFRLNPVGQTLGQDLNINDSEPTHNNSTLLIFVEEYND